ncbi:MAG TPA: hypothetical protein VMG80_00505, partial [Solirubrobacteraceae bacterium]|nr:hypothetical protein [Solirubrobacteraceae bacterium]
MAGADAAKPADVLVVFGITGDLAKVMTFRSLYRLERRGLLQCPIVGVAVSDWTVEQLREHARECIVGTGETVDDEVFARFAARLSYVSGDFTDAATYERLGQTIASVVGGADGPSDAGAKRAAGAGDAAGAGGAANSPVFYLEIPPSLFGPVVGQLAGAGLVGAGGRVVVEKPFGHDLASAMALADELHQYIDESQLYRIDHYLGKMG